MSVLFALVAGMFSWTVAEYAIHRFLGHSPTSRHEFAVEHRKHHKVAGYFSTTTKKLLGVLPPALAGGIGASWLLGPIGTALVVGFLLMWGIYEVLHRRIHVAEPIGAYGRWLRRLHLLHHHRAPNENYGVTSPIWDIVFGTFVPVNGPVKIPRAKAPPWLLDAEGEVQPRWASEYELAGAPRR